MRENLTHGSTGRRWRRASLWLSDLRAGRKRSGIARSPTAHDVPRQRFTLQIYFSIVQRKVLTPSDSLSLDELERRILDFQARYEESAVPFEWKFTRRDLAALLRRIAEHEQLTAAA